MLQTHCLSKKKDLNKVNNLQPKPREIEEERFKNEGCIAKAEFSIFVCCCYSIRLF